MIPKNVVVGVAPSVSLCFPAHNEESTVRSIIEEAHALATQAELDFEIVVCNDGSTDGTGLLLDQLSARRNNIRVIHHPTRLGIRVTFEQLYAEATREFVFLNSTDGQWDTRILLDMLPLVTQWDVIIANRRRKPYGPARQLVSWAFNAIPPLLFATSTVDAGAVKLQRREIIQRFDLVSRSPFSEAERLIRASRAGYRFTFFPVEGSHRRAGRERGASWRLVAEAMLDVARVWRALRNLDRVAAAHPRQTSDLPVST